MGSLCSKEAVTSTKSTEVVTTPMSQNSNYAQSIDPKTKRQSDERTSNFNDDVVEDRGASTATSVSNDTNQLSGSIGQVSSVPKPQGTKPVSVPFPVHTSQSSSSSSSSSSVAASSSQVVSSTPSKTSAPPPTLQSKEKAETRQKFQELLRQSGADKDSKQKSNQRPVSGGTGAEIPGKCGWLYRKNENFENTAGGELFIQVYFAHIS